MAKVLKPCPCQRVNSTSNVQEFIPVQEALHFQQNIPFYAKAAIKEVGGSDKLLTELFRQKMAKMGLEMKSEAVPDILYPMGFPTLDYLNGFVAHQMNEFGEMQEYYNVGITDGSYVSFVGNTSVGKSTFVNQIAANIVRKFPQSQIFVDDVESGMTEERRRFLYKFTKDEYDNKVIVRNLGVSAENIYKRLKSIYDLKTKDQYQNYLYDSGRRDYSGNPIMKLVPTIYIIDSIAALMPEDMLEMDEMEGKSYGARTASVMSQLMQACIQLLKAANIILIGINHFSTDVQMGPFPKPPDVPWLKQGERIPKGRKATLLANNIFRMDNFKKLKLEEGYKIEGSVVKLSLVKSRSSGIKRPIPLVYEFVNGFDPWMSMLEYLRENNLLYGAGASLAIDPEKVFKFSLGTFKDKINNDIEFRKAFMTTMGPILKSIPMAINESNNSDMMFNDILDNLYN